MTEKTIKDADKTLVQNDGHRRFKEWVDMSRTPLEEIEEARLHEKGEKQAYGRAK